MKTDYMCDKIITPDMLERLRGEVRARLTERRFRHTEGVAAEAAAIAGIYTPELATKITAAAWLHDITKEYSYEKQLKICHDFGIILKDDEKNLPAVLHAITAAALIPAEFPEYADPVIISAVRWHTTGRAGMTLPEKILCLADFIEPGREYAGCRKAWQDFWSANPGELNQKEREALLDRILIFIFESKLAYARSRGFLVNSDIEKTLQSLNSSTY
jgi:HD superfamily phosphohydrolase YqeK